MFLIQFLSLNGRASCTRFLLSLSASLMTAFVITMPCSGSVCVHLPCRYEVTILPNYSCGWSQYAGSPTAINNHGHVAGLISTCYDSYTKSFLWDGGSSLAIIPMPEEMYSFHATDINDHGVIVGDAWITNVGRRAVIYNTHSQEWTILPTAHPKGLGWSSASAINNKGQVVGYRSIGSEDDPVNPRTAFIWDPLEGMKDLGVMLGPNSTATDISESSTVVGWTGRGPLLSDTRAFISQGDTLTICDPVPDGVSSEARSISRSGRVVLVGKTTEDMFGPFQAYIWHDGVMSHLGSLPGFESVAPHDINNSDFVIGSCLNPGVNSTLYIWHDGSLHALDDLIDPSIGLTTASGARINDSGVIVGEGIIPSMGFISYVLHPVPRVMGDANCDEVVDVADLLDIISQWGACTGCSADFDSNNTVDIMDLFMVIDNWSVP